MKVSDAQLEKLLALESSQDLKSTLAQRNMQPSAGQANKLLQHMGSLEGSPRKVRLGIVHTYTSELLDPWLNFTAALNQLDWDIYHAPYGMTIQEADANSGLAKHAPDVTLLLLQREDFHPAFLDPITNISAADRPAVQEQFLGALSALINRLRDCISGQIIVTLLPNASPPGLGLYDDVAENSETHWWNTVRAAIGNEIRLAFSGVSYLDLEQQVAQIGRNNFFDERLWHASVFPFTPDGAFSLCNAVATLAASLHMTKAKVIVLDADNTLWGGVIGEDGMSGIALGPEYPGSVYVQFQKRILSLQQRGFILALCSKNNPEDLDEVLTDHPHQVIKDEHFAARRVNWLPKPDNLKSLAEELNLGLDSFIFVDDSDYECSAVKHSLPDVNVIQVPSRTTEIPTCLDTLARLEITSLTSEDLAKTAMYAQERARREQLDHVSTGAGSIDDYLLSLNICMTIGLNDDTVLPRLAQLTQKTNQFNLTTRRYSEPDIAAKISSDNCWVYHFSLADSFGDSGVVGLAIVEREQNDVARLDTFLMSCRVIGRRAEEAFLKSIMQNLKGSGFKTLSAHYIPTRKNVLVEAFLPDNGFDATAQDEFSAQLDAPSYQLDDAFPMEIQGSLFR